MLPKSNKVTIGLIFIGGAFFFAFTGFYLWMVKPTSAGHAVKVQSPTPPIEPQAEDIVRSVMDKTPVIEEKTPVETLVERAEELYGPEEKNRKDGYLWVDQQAAKWVVTLGALHGLGPGKYLNVYRSGERIGQVAIDQAFDVISYVRPTDSSFSMSDTAYYRVAME